MDEREHETEHETDAETDHDAAGAHGATGDDHVHGEHCDHDHDGPSPLERLRLCLLHVEAPKLRDGLRLLGRSQADQVAKAVGVKAPILVRSATPANHLRKAVDRTVLLAVADAVVAPCLDATVDELGEHADDPTLEQLQAALDVVEPEHGRDVVRLMLAAVAAMGMPATDVCEELLAGERYAAPTEEPPEQEAPAPTVVAPVIVGSTVDPAEQAAKREARKARREQQRSQKARPQAVATARRKSKRS